MALVSPDVAARWVQRPKVFRVIVWLASVLLTSLTGPFDTYTMLTFWERAFYWGAVIGVAMISGLAIQALTLWATGDPPGVLRADLIASAALSLSFGPLLWAFNLWGMGGDVASPLLFIEHVLVVWVVCMLGIAFQHYMRHRSVAAADVQATHPIDNPATSPFLRRLSPELGDEVLRVSADDHYLLVVTTLGEERILMRFRDALEELADLPGHQIHRSHWVAAHIIVRVRQDGRRYLADLSDGKAMPVSRAYLETLREAGFPET